jgi:hypothetical protein
MAAAVADGLFKRVPVKETPFERVVRMLSGITEPPTRLVLRDDIPAVPPHLFIHPGPIDWSERIRRDHIAKSKP